MLRGLFFYFVGNYSFSVELEAASTAANLLIKEHASPLCTVLDESCYSFKLTASDARRVLPRFDECALPYVCSELRGLPRVFPFLRHRPGIALGALLLVAVSFLSARTVWGLEVVGNGTVPDSEILFLLEELGCGCGDYIPKMDIEQIQARFLAVNHDISWIAVNFSGNFATVEVIETDAPERVSRGAEVYANIVASEDAQVCLVKTEHGKRLVSGGDIVKEGELLISGVIDVNGDRVRYEYAAGEVLAYVTRKIELSVPFEHSVKTYTGSEKTQKTIKIFKKSINLFSKGGIEYSLYDKIKDDRQICLFGFRRLPIFVSETTYREYEYVSETLSPKRAEAMARLQLREELDALLEECELVSNKVCFDVTEDSFRVCYDMLCTTNIARVSEFTVGE